MPLHHPAGHCQRTTQTQSRGPSRAATQKPLSDGTTHIVMSPLEFMQRLAALVPRPQVQLYFSFRGKWVFKSLIRKSTYTCTGYLSALIRSAHFSPIIMVVMHGLTVTSDGITEPSTTRSPRTPLTRNDASSGAERSSSAPIFTVHDG